MFFPILLLAVMLGGGEAGKLFYDATGEDEGIICPNRVSKCPVDHTCCKLNDDWGCCPFARATCCSDNIHCCPQGYSCDGLKQQCVKAINNETIPWAKKVQAPVSSTETASPENLICPDGTSCVGLSACCRTSTGSYRCCNYPNNVCCSDGYHCCPRCSVCDSRAFKCIPGFSTAEWKTVGVTKSTPSTSQHEASSPVNEEN